jgi:hypothetical protein
VSVLEGEGTTVILYGSTDVSTGARSYDGYLARPDLIGEWPTVVVVSPSDGVSSSVKAICRGLARHGIAAVAPAAGGLDVFIRFITNPAGHWSNAEHGFGVLGLGDGCGAAVAGAAESDAVVALALIDPALDDVVVAALDEVDVPVLGCAARDAASVQEARAAAPQSEWVLYDGVESGYWDVNSDAYVANAAEDTESRVVEFFSGPLPARI